VRVEKTSGNQSFDDSAVQALKRFGKKEDCGFSKSKMGKPSTS